MDWFEKTTSELGEFAEFVISNIQKIAGITVAIWLALPIVFFFLYAVYLVITKVTEAGIIRLIEMGVDVALPWYVDVILHPFRVILELILIGLIVGGFMKYR